jgi:hypothetical protein
MTEFSESIEVVSGAPTAEELAIVIAMLEAAHSEEVVTSSASENPQTSTWSRNSDQLRRPITPGPGQWRGAYSPSRD